MQFPSRSRALLRRPTRHVDTLTPEGRLAPATVRRGLRLSTVEGAMATVHISITTGAFITGFALMLGAGDFELGVMGALPFVGQLFQFVGAYLEERLGQRRPLVVYSAVGSRLLWTLIAALPFMSWLGNTQLVVFLMILVAAQALLGICGNAWTSWMTDLVPPRERGRYFGTRNTVAAVSSMISTWLAGIALDQAKIAGNEAWGYAVIFGAGVFFGVMAGVVLRFQPEPPMERRAQKVDVGALFSAPVRNRSFRTFALVAAGWALVTGIASPFFNAYGIQNLHLSFQTLALMGIVTSGVTMLTMPYIGRVQDRFGDKLVLVVSAVGVVALPWGWTLSTPDFLLPVWLTSIFSGVFWPGITQGLLNMLMTRAPAEGRGAYVAAFGAINGAGTFTAALLGGTIASLLGSTLLHLGPLTIGNYAILFVLTSLGRAVMAWVFVRTL